MSDEAHEGDIRKDLNALAHRIDGLAALLREDGPATWGSESSLREIRDRLAVLAGQLADMRADSAERAVLEQRIAELTSSRDAVASNLSRLQSRKAVRLALSIANRLDRIRRWTRGRFGANVRIRPAVRSQAEVAFQLRALRPARGRTDGPHVSIVIPTRDGAHHLERLFEALRRTAYTAFDIVLIDNGSTDATQELISHYADLHITCDRSEQNRTFAESCNLGAAAAQGRYLLFLNNDTEPINTGWLGALVDALEESGDVVAAGALLVYPAGRSTTAVAQRPLSVQHRGISFTWKDGGPRPVNLGTGEEPDQRGLTETINVAAATAACLLVDRAEFEAVGGFTERYVYGWEDVDLCMKLRHERGEVVMCGGAALFHYEFGTQDALDAETRRVNYLNNSRVFLEQWAPQLRRLYLRDRIHGRGFWATEASRSIAITVTDNDKQAGFGDWYTAHELGDALEAEGWSVSYLQRKNDEWYDTNGADVVIMLLPHLDIRRLPEGTFTVAWVRNWVERWLENPSFHDIDLVVASTRAFAEQIEQATSHRVDVLPLATNPARFRPVQEDIALRCDYTFTGSFWGTGRLLERYLDVQPGETFTIYGKGWDKRPRGQRYWRGHLDYDRLPALYSSAKLVLDDTVEPNVPAVNSRVFDALASGGLVISDNPIGSDEWFDGRLPTYFDRSSLREQLDHFLSSSDERAALVAELRDLVLERHTYAQRAQQFTRLIESSVERPEIALRIGPVTWQNAEQWGDTHFARDMTRALRRLGWRTRLSVVSDWDSPRDQAADVVLHLRGRTPYTVKPGNLNTMWLISHPDDVQDSELEKYDLVFVASRMHAVTLAAHVRVPVFELLQASAVERYTTAEIDPSLETRLVFVGNSRGERRRVVDWAIENGLPLTVYGTGWADLIPPEHVGGAYFPNDRLPDLYRTADIVLSDHWPDMRDRGFISNRVFDALAAGAFLISDHVPGMHELLNGTVTTVDSPEQLVEAYARLTSDPGARRAQAEKGAVLVRSAHSFDARAVELNTIIIGLLSGSAGIPGGSPDLDRIGNLG